MLRVFTDCRLPVHKVAFSPNGKWLAAAGEESRVRIFDLATSSQIYELKDHPSSVSDIVWQADSQKLATATVNGTIRTYDVSELEINTSNFDVKVSVAHNSSSSGSYHPQATLLSQYGSHCKRLVRLKFNEDNGLSCIGSV